MPPLQLEVCVDSVESAVAAERGGADRVELCAGLDVGGVTPSAGLILAVRNRLSIGVHVMIRPRPGDFCYSKLEFETMERDAAFCRKAGVEGIVTGILTPRGNLDLRRMRRLVMLARPLTVTVHRAFDEVRQWRKALEGVREIGVKRILTAGAQDAAPAGEKRIRALAEASRGSVEIMAGSGITAANVGPLLSIPSLSAVHVLSSVSERRDNAKSRRFADSSFIVRQQRVQRLKTILERTQSTTRK